MKRLLTVLTTVSLSSMVSAGPGSIQSYEEAQAAPQSFMTPSKDTRSQKKKRAQQKTAATEEVQAIEITETV